MPLPFRNRQTQLDRDPQALAERLAQNHPLVAFAPRRGHEAGFVQRTNSLRAGSLLLTHGYTSPIEGALGEERGIAYVNLCLAGSIRYRTQGLSQAIHPEQPLWFCPGAEYRYTTDLLNALVMRLDEDLLEWIRANLCNPIMAPPSVSASRIWPPPAACSGPSSG
jgi:hypothetical protein